MILKRGWSFFIERVVSLVTFMPGLIGSILVEDIVKLAVVHVIYDLRITNQLPRITATNVTYMFEYSDT